VKILTEIGAAYFYMKQNDLSVHFYKKALDLIRETEHSNSGSISRQSKAIIYFNIGSIMILMGDLDYAEQIIEEGAQLNRTLNDLTIKTGLLISRGLIFFKRGELERALKSYEEALQILSHHRSTTQLVPLYNNLGEYYSMKGDRQQAINYYLKALETGQAIRAFRSVQIAAEELCKLYALENNYKEAYRFHLLDKKLSDSLFNIENHLHSSQLSNIFEIDAKIRKIESAHEENQSRLKLRQIFLIAGLIILALVIFIISLWLNNIRAVNRRLVLEQEKNNKEQEVNILNQEKQKMDLDYKNRLLATNAMHLSSKSEFIQTMYRKIQSTMEKLPENQKDQFAEILGECKMNLRGNDWQEFELRFNEIHPDYYKRLKQRYPELSNADVKIAGLLLLNLSSKEIASITSRTPDSVKISRSRLRKKLGMNTDDNLIALLQQV
jgi:tetratricopeptide (TPR) repeat protein